MQKLTLLLLLTLYGSAQEYYYKNHQKIVLYPYAHSVQSAADIDYYRDEKGTIIGVIDRIIIKIADESQIGTYGQKYHLDILKKLSDTLYLVQVEDKSKTLETANSLDREDGVVYAQPDFVKMRRMR